MATCSRRRCSSSTRIASHRRKCTCRWRCRTRRRRRSRTGCRRAPSAASACWCRSAARSAACSTSRRGTPKSRTSSGSTRTSRRTTTRSRRCASSWRCRRCRGASSASTSRRSRAAIRSRRWSCARTAGCGKGSIGSSGSGVGCRDPGLGTGSPFSSRWTRGFDAGGTTGPRVPSPESPTANNDFAAMNEVVRRRYRRILESGGPFPDLILIDGGKGQLTRGLRGARGAGARPPHRRRHREEGRTAVHARPRGADRAAGRQPGAAPDPADPRRGAPVRGDVPSPAPDEARSSDPISTRFRTSGRGGARRC